MVYQWSNWLQSFLFPPQCRLCLAHGHQGLDLCADCRAELPWLAHACRRCALPLPASANDLCGRCLRRPPALDACHALFAYSPPVDGWVQALKFHRDLALASLLGQLLAQHPAATADGNRPELLAVPLHPRRLRQRGYNQALELARPLFRRGFRSAACDCRRDRHTEAQSGLDRPRRRSNLRGAFRVSGLPAGRDLLLIDDVMTTGATLNELAATLKRAGARRVAALVVARTLGDT